MDLDIDLYNIPEPTSDGLPEPLENLIVLTQADYAAHNQLLAKILAAIKLEEGVNVAIHQIHPEETVSASHLAHKATRLIAFGLKPAQLGINGKFKGYRFFKTETFSLLFSHSLEKLAGLPEKKKNLWQALQAEFLKSEK